MMRRFSSISSYAPGLSVIKILIPSHTPFGDDEAELLKFSMNLWGLPSPGFPAPDDGPGHGPRRWFWACPRALEIANPKDPKPCSMPRDRWGVLSGICDSSVGLGKR